MMLKRKVALVTGGGTGIGRAIALKLAENGANVAIASRNLSHLEQTGEELRILGYSVLPSQMDLRNKSDVERAVGAIVAQWGAVHILVNNAGRSGLSMMNDPDDATWHDIIDTNLNGLYLVTKAVLEKIPDHDGGRIINISSVLGKFGVPGYTAYCATKHGMIGFSRALALEVVHRGITVNTICPGWVDTEMCDIPLAGGGRARIAATIPVGRVATPHDIAAPIVFLCSPEARHITGEIVNVNGGSVLCG